MSNIKRLDEMHIPTEKGIRDDFVLLRIWVFNWDYDNGGYSTQEYGLPDKLYVGGDILEPAKKYLEDHNYYPNDSWFEYTDFGEKGVWVTFSPERDYVFQFKIARTTEQTEDDLIRNKLSQAETEVDEYNI